MDQLKIGRKTQFDYSSKSSVEALKTIDM